MDLSLPGVTAAGAGPHGNEGWRLMRPAGSDTIEIVNEARAYASLLRLVAERIERLSADSKWAHRASGVRGQVLRTLDQLDLGEDVPLPVLHGLIDTALDILRAAAREIA